SHSNNYTVNGVNFIFNNVTDGNIKVNVKNDVDQAVDKIVEFVDKYNKIIEEMNGKTEEKKYRDFPPLTDKQKEDMEEKEIELWNEKAKSGVLRNDSVLENGLSSMRTNWYTPVDNNGDFQMMSEIGITTSSNYREGGKLLINEDELRKALSTDPESVHKLFAGTEEKPGVARRIENSIETTISSIERKAGKSTTLDNNFLLGRRIKDMDDQMERFEERLAQIEDRYWAQFGAMESAIQKMNSQSAYLMQNFG
ncbi:MAG: flagellar filament capping protein FliD, partial [Halobacillus sp.]|uniref:flagellar filament capping protein FliD n=1 Tax=Halobacillus sp. TaxID=56800 RepID=UPI003BB16C05